MTRTLLIGLLLGAAALAASVDATFHKDVVPILQKNCQACHRPGEVAPMSLISFQEARPYARAIKAAVVTKKMPPWFADARYGHFTNAKGLTQDEIDTLAAWADRGAPEGNAKDAPPPVKFPQGWMIPTPELVVEMQEDQQIPATGIVDNYYIIVPGNFTEDTWVTAAEVRPSNKANTHHMRVWVRPPDSNWLAGAPYGKPVPLGYRPPGGAARRPAAGARTGVQELIAKYNPGLEPMNFAIDGAAKLLPKGSDIVFETHYTTTGKPASDRSKIGFHVAKAPLLKRYFTSGGLSANRIEIPPGDPNYEARSAVTIEQDMKLTWLQPHMHIRGKDYELTAVYPSGEREILLKTDYDFEWQIGYQFEKPVLLPKGTRLLAVSHFDNSANKRANPDPTATVRWGLQSTDEMSLIYLGLIVEKSTDVNRLFQRLGGNALE